MKQFPFLILFLFFSLNAFTQNKVKVLSDKQIELGLNITNTLAGFFNSGGESLRLDPYLLSVKFVKGQRAIRTALNFKVTTRNEFENNGGFGGNRDTQLYSADMRVGWEWRKTTSKRLTVYWGADIIGGYDYEKVDFSSFTGTTLRLEETIGRIGGGPAMGIIFSLNESIFLSTEAAVYGQYERGQSNNDLLPGMPEGKMPIEGFSLVPMVPNTLYLNVRF